MNPIEASVKVVSGGALLWYLRGSSSSSSVRHLSSPPVSDCHHSSSISVFLYRALGPTEAQNNGDYDSDYDDKDNSASDTKYEQKNRGTGIKT